VLKGLPMNFTIHFHNNHNYSVKLSCYWFLQIWLHWKRQGPRYPFLWKSKFG